MHRSSAPNRLTSKPNFILPQREFSDRSITIYCTDNDIFSFWSGPVEIPTYTRAEIEAYSTVADDVSGSAAPAIPSPADAWSGEINNA